MIKFKKVRWANLLSTGNDFTELDLDTHKSTLIVGKNGHGKSTLIEALTFCLYNRPFRNINKPQLVNSITNKNMITEVEFSIGTNEYKVRRGIKPNLFEIIKNGELLDQTASNDDYQEMLEKNILNMNYKAFCQIVILGSASYTPFMQLKPADRRKVIEDILDIEIFSTMASILKDRLSENKEAIKEVQSKIDLATQTLKITEQMNKEASDNNDLIIKQKNDKLEELKEELKDFLSNQKEIQDQIDQVELVQVSSLRDKKDNLIRMQASLEQKIKKAKSDVNFFHDNEDCPTCKQNIDKEFRDHSICTKNSKILEFEDGLSKLKLEIEKVNSKIKSAEEHNSRVDKLKAEVDIIENNLRFTKRTIKSLLEEIDSLEQTKNRIEEKKDTESIRRNIADLEKEKADLEKKKTTFEYANILLKDTGIKAKIIHEYIPIVNDYINKYLSDMGFFVHFEIDENFNETIKSRHTDVFSYSSFSEGEKFRINLSLLFSWRAVAKMRNSASTNLLLMDEVADSSLDDQGTDGLIDILHTLEDTNVIVISHKGEFLQDMFDRTVKFDKVSNFSKMKVLK